MKINEETTVSEEQVLFNKLNWEEQQFILKQMRMLQPCELECEIEKEKKIPEKITVQDLLDLDTGSLLKRIVDNQNEIIDYLKSKGE